MAGQVRFNHYWPNRVLLCSEVGVITCTVIPIEDWLYMYANTSNIDKYDYNHTQNQMLDTKVE